MITLDTTTKQTQEQMVLEMLKSGKKTTADFGRHPHLWAEYRRAISNLRKKVRIEARQIKKGLWEYELVESNACTN